MNQFAIAIYLECQYWLDQQKRAVEHAENMRRFNELMGNEFGPSIMYLPQSRKQWFTSLGYNHYEPDIQFLPVRKRL